MSTDKNALELLQKAFWLKVDYTPSTEQSIAHVHPSAIKLASGGVRAGKSKFTAMEMAKTLFIEDGLIWILCPDHSQGAAEFMYLLRPLQELGWIASFSTPSQGAQEFTTVWGLKVETVSIKQGLEHIASFAPDFIAIVEAGQHPYGSFEKALERGAEKNAPILISGTLEKNKFPWFSQKFREWQGPNELGASSFSLPSWSNLAVFPGGREDEKIKRAEAGLSEAKFMERFAAVPLKPEGLVFGEFDFPTHVSESVKYIEDVPVGIAVDPGYGGAYAVVFIQKIGYFYNCLGEVYMRRTKGRDVIEVVKRHPLWEKTSYMVIDVAAKQHHAGDSQVEIWEDNCPQLAIYYNQVGILDGIEILSSRLKNDPIAERPYLMFGDNFRSDVDIDGSSLGLFSEFDLYRWADRAPTGNERNLPIDANNHAVKAITYFIYHHDGTMLLDSKPEVVQKQRGYWR